jgi:hypothetical protein
LKAPVSAIVPQVNPVFWYAHGVAENKDPCVRL